MKKRVFLASAAITLLAGCGAYNEFKLNNAVQEYKETCFGNYTNECESKLVDTNIITLEFMKTQMSRQKDEMVKAFGDEGYAMYLDVSEKVLDQAIARQENMRPGWFARWFLGEGQPFSSSRNLLLGYEDLQEIRNAITGRFVAEAKSKGMTPKVASAEAAPVAQAPVVAPAPMPVQAPLPQAVAAPTTGSLDSAIANALSAATREDGGDEYPDGRKILRADLNGDGQDDALVIYVIEGQGGSNSSFSTLGVFYANNGAFDFKGSTVVSGAVTALQLQDDKTIRVSSLEVGPEDAFCCPTLESEQKYRWDGNHLEELREAPLKQG
ncbi:LppP/LprE family lipoprotein [Pseudomonas nunensis]|uniref:LppP/LprE family lipoprotein n=1 Tax=Pseudomonas nunensis TaxID=2961896 RepID=UPI0025B07174|nr:LppP/LprE family lipoprotein [Pseudomonas nunensis]MDN3219318.1 LppP/LprE family lipoprotein [Pseudomonas nunensis]